MLCVPRDALSCTKSLWNTEKRRFFCSEKNLSRDFKRASVFASFYSSSRSKKSFWRSSSSQRARFNRDTDRQTDLFSKLQIVDPFLSLQNEWTVTDRPLNNGEKQHDVNIIRGRERFQIRLRDTKKFLPPRPRSVSSKSAAKGKDILGKSHYGCRRQTERAGVIVEPTKRRTK